MGILLYLSPDLPQCQYVMRYLSTFSSKPTQKTMIVLKHLVGYLAGHADQHVSLRWKGIHSGLLKDYECDEPVLEVFSDADWASGHQTVTLDVQCQELPFLWRLSGLLLQSNTEDCVTSQRRVRNVCSRQRSDGCNPH